MTIQRNLKIFSIHIGSHRWQHPDTTHATAPTIKSPVMKFMKPNMPSQYPRFDAPPFSLLFAHQFSQTSATIRMRFSLMKLKLLTAHCSEN